MLTRDEYELLQKRFSQKMRHEGTNKSSAYNEGVLACKSILHEFKYEHKGVNDDRR